MKIRRIIPFLAFILVTNTALLAGNRLPGDPPAKNQPPSTLADDLPTVKNDVFVRGERLEYRVHYGFVTAGKGVVEVKPLPVYVKGRKCYHIVGSARSAKTFDWFFPVRDKYETFVDEKAMVPWKFKRVIKEGKFDWYGEIEFDHYKHKAYETRRTRVLPPQDIPDGIQDVLSAMYFARTQDFSNAKPGDIFVSKNFIDKKVHDLEVEFIGRETLKIGSHKYKTVKLKPLVQEGGLFKHEGDMFLWISDDQNKIPIRMESAVVVGAVKADLIRAQGLKHPFTSRIK